MANVCQWETDETRVKKDCSECKEGEVNGPNGNYPRCSAQNEAMAPSFLLPARVLPFMIPTLAMPFPKAATYAPAGYTSPSPWGRKVIHYLPPQNRQQPIATMWILRSTAGNAPTFTTSIVPMHVTASVEVVKPISKSMGFGWGCIKAMNKNEIMNQPGSKDGYNVIERSECVQSLCPQDSKTCWKPMYFKGCNDCSSLDMFGLDTNNP